MVCCEVGSGITASFWHDNWTSLCPFIELVGERGPQVSGLNINAVVADALSREGWWLDRSRSRNPIIMLLKEVLPNAQEVIDSEVDDKYVWFPEADQGNGSISASNTWRALHPYPIEVFWYKVVWFSGRIPKHAFMTWGAARDRMVTKDSSSRSAFGACYLAISFCSLKFFADSMNVLLGWRSFLIAVGLCKPAEFFF